MRRYFFWPYIIFATYCTVEQTLLYLRYRLRGIFETVDIDISYKSGTKQLNFLFHAITRRFTLHPFILLF